MACRYLQRCPSPDNPDGKHCWHYNFNSPNTITWTVYNMIPCNTSWGCYCCWCGQSQNSGWYPPNQWYYTTCGNPLHGSAGSGTVTTPFVTGMKVVNNGSLEKTETAKCSPQFLSESPT